MLNVEGISWNIHSLIGNFYSKNNLMIYCVCLGWGFYHRNWICLIFCVMPHRNLNFVVAECFYLFNFEEVLHFWYMSFSIVIFVQSTSSYEVSLTFEGNCC